MATNTSRSVLRLATILIAVILTAFPAYAGFNASAPPEIRRIFTEMAFAESRLIAYHVLEPGPSNVQAFPVSPQLGTLLRFPGCPGLRPVLDDSAKPSPDTDHLIPDKIVREVFNIELTNCIQPTSAVDALRHATSMQSIGFVNAPSVPAPLGAPVPLQEQQSAAELWGPVPNVGVNDVFAGEDLSPQHIRATTVSGLPVAEIQQPIVRRPRIMAYTADQVVYFITYETRGLSSMALTTKDTEDQWNKSGFPGERNIYILSYGRAPLPPNKALPAGSLDSNGIPNDMQAVINIAGGAPFWNPGQYSPLWRMICADNGISPAIGPGMPCGSVRYYEIGQPRSLAELKATGTPLVKGIFSDIECPVIATDVNDDGTFADTPGSRELVRFANVDWDGDGQPDDGLNDLNSTLL
jgi:hypothetical protein